MKNLSTFFVFFEVNDINIKIWWQKLLGVKKNLFDLNNPKEQLKPW